MPKNGLKQKSKNNKDVKISTIYKEDGKSFQALMEELLKAIIRSK